MGETAHMTARERLQAVLDRIDEYKARVNGLRVAAQKIDAERESIRDALDELSYKKSMFDVDLPRIPAALRATEEELAAAAAEAAWTSGENGSDGEGALAEKPTTTEEC